MKRGESHTNADGSISAIDREEATFQPWHIPFVCPRDTWASETQFNEEVDKLLNKICEQREGNAERPVVLIGYAYDGTLIEKALVIANVDQKPILNSLAGIIFLTTPFPGTFGVNADTKNRLKNSGQRVSV